MSALSVVVVGGSRSLPPVGLAVCRVLARCFAAGGYGLATCCAAGADLAFLSTFVRSGAAARAVVFGVGAASGSGFLFPRSARVLSWAAGLGARVFWSAGGSHPVPFVGRLAARAAAAVRTASCAGVWVVSSSESRGSLVAAGVAARAGLPVFFFCVDFPPSALPALPGKYKDSFEEGAWSAPVCSVLGVPCVQWVPASRQMALF